MEKMAKMGFPIYKELADAYDFYNSALFAGMLPVCIVTLDKNVNYFGCFRPLNFVGNGKENEGRNLHEITMNVTFFALRPIEMTLSTVVHEMCHLKTYEDGTYGCGKYHNREFAELMKSVGLIPSSTGKPGGKETGQSVSHYIEKNGLFERKTRELMEKGFLFPFVERLREQVRVLTVEEIKKKAIPEKPGFFRDDDGSIIKGKTYNCGKDEKGKEIVKVVIKDEQKWRRSSYQCECGTKIQGKSGLDITCNECGTRFVEENVGG